MNGDLDGLGGCLLALPGSSVPDVEQTFDGSVGVGLDGEVVGASDTGPELLILSQLVLDVSLFNFEGSVGSILNEEPFVTGRGVSFD